MSPDWTDRAGQPTGGPGFDGWLPPIRRGGAVYRLPRRPAVTTAIASVLTATLADPTTPIPASSVAAVERAALAEPSLDAFLVATAAGRSLADQLSDWPTLFSGDVDPPDPPDAALVRRFEELDDYFRSLPPERRFDELELYLAAVGPPVDASWRATWRRTSDPSNPRDTSGNWLSALASLAAARPTDAAAEAERRRREKIDALVELSQGLSHEINNALANISTRAETLIRADEIAARGENGGGQMTPADRIDALRRVIEQVYRAHGMIADLMFFARPPSPTTAVYDASAQVQTLAEEFAAAGQRQSIRFNVRTNGPIPVDADQAMIGEAVRCLIRNAMEAIGCQGTIVLTATAIGPTATDDRNRNGHPLSGGVRIDVADSGPGLSDHARRHAFDPYFSGREAGRGLGLGLCRAYRIAQLHGGDISLAGGVAGCVATLTIPPAGERPAAAPGEPRDGA